ncbi:putative transcription factor, MBF1-like protein [Halalkaliarchaeum sp. AArc-CO]|uniref:helix-turn-helix domain-containing protein n=1 Tax=unclassified Halalkaliarchaeum TaxID=2678344 RepID=UPI00217E333C|nr:MULTISPECIES: multiprotein-bridging factor 1 family protein [unclassified Halalkaliarchaeum]MDR5673178.1 multiprotein-bridging factor 1 family protein [Halalkaliarchaeum sp. AArc-GB]UWG51867.1 putative transcription factor, MBF1-like protein [Halalkaliarchaeum sp. AArc-CO]
MAKYSTGGGGGGGDGDACELCGRETGNLRLANVAGAELLVCRDCEPHGSNRKQTEKKHEREGSRDDDGPSRKKRAAQRAAKMYDAGKGDSSHWEKEGTDYEKDRLPYLLSDYGERAERARQDAGLRIEELAAELDVDEDDLLAIEQGRAARANVGGSVVRAVEEHLDVELVDE